MSVIVSGFGYFLRRREKLGLIFKINSKTTYYLRARK
jgi:hypothetical protein